MKIVYYFFTLCLLSFFNGVFMGQSSWRPMLNRTQIKRFVPIYYPSSSSRNSDSPEYETNSESVLNRRISNQASLPNKFQFTNETNLSYNQAEDGYGLGLNVLHNRNGGQGYGAMSVNSYVGAPEPLIDAAEPRGEYQKQNDIDGYFRNYQSPDHVKDNKMREEMRFKPSEGVVYNEGKNYNYDQNRAEEQGPKNAFDGNRIQEINHFFSSLAPKKYTNQAPLRNEFDQNKNPVTNYDNNAGNKRPIVNDRHPFLHFYNQNKNKFGNNNYDGDSDTKTFPRIETEKTDSNEFRRQLNNNNNFDQNKNPIVTDAIRYSSAPNHPTPNHPFEKTMVAVYNNNNNNNYNYDQNKNPVPNNNNGFHSAKAEAAVNLDQNRNEFNGYHHPTIRNKPRINEMKPVEQQLINREPPNNNNNYFSLSNRKVRPIFENGPKQTLQNPLYRFNSVVEKPLFYGDFDFKLRRIRY